MSGGSLSRHASTLQDLPIFKMLPEQVLEELANQAEAVTIPKDREIIAKGDSGDSMYVLLKGVVRVHDQDQLLATLIAGEYFGEYALIDHYTRSATVTTNQVCELLILKGNSFRSVMEQYPKSRDAIMKQLTKRLRDLNVMQEQLMRKNQEIREQTLEIEGMNTQLQAMNEQKSYIMKVLAHELRNTLTAGITLGESLQQEIMEKTPELNEYMQPLNKSLWRMSQSVDRMLESESKIEVGEVRAVEFSLTELLENVKDQFKDLASGKKIKLTLKGDHYLVKLDRSLTRQILEIIIGGAIKFSPGGAKVGIKVFTDQERLCISIKDQGPGFTAEALKPLTVPELGQDVILHNPSDLSLSIIRRYTESMGGTVKCISKPGKGAEFILRFNEFTRTSADKGLWGLFK